MWLKVKSRCINPVRLFFSYTESEVFFNLRGGLWPHKGQWAALPQPETNWKRGEKKGLKSRNTLMLFYTAKVICLALKTIRYATEQTPTTAGSLFSMQRNVYTQTWHPLALNTMWWATVVKGPNSMWRWYLLEYDFQQSSCTVQYGVSAEFFWGKCIWFGKVLQPTSECFMHTLKANSKFPWCCLYPKVLLA